MNRRDFLAFSSLTLPLMAARSNQPANSTLGIATTSYMIAWRPKDTMEFLEHCHQLGAGGIQSAINGDIPAIRARAEKYGMYVEAMVPMPKGNDTADFEHALQNAKAVGAVALRSACLGTRRYETFKSLADWQAHVAESHQSIEAARPLLDKYKIPLGLENHKDWTADELVALMKKYGSEYLGVCLDFGNNISLLDNPMEVIEKLAPVRGFHAPERHGRRVIRRRLPALRSAAWKRLSGLASCHLPGASGAFECALLTRNDHTRSTEGALPGRPILGDIPGPERPLSGAYAAVRSGTSESKSTAASFAAHTPAARSD